MPIFLWLWTFRVDPHKTIHPHGHKHLEIAKSSQPKLPLWRTLGSKMMTCRWKCHGQQSINSKTVFYLPCPSDLVGVGRLSAIIWDPVKVCPCPCSANFSSGSLPLLVQDSSHLFFLRGVFFSLPCLFPEIYSAVSLQWPPFVGLIHLTHHCHVNKAIIIKRLYLIIYIYIYI